jgi:predicted dehydrogenase
VRTPATIGVVGLGAWGPSLARVFSDMPQTTLRWVCDLNAEAVMEMQRRHPGVRYTRDVTVLLEDDGLDAVVIATPPATHYELALAALRADKHVFVEKPLALRSEDADMLVRESQRRNRCLMVGHVLLFHPAVRKLRELIDTGALGDIFYLYANRQNLGRVRREENALWSLGTHDVAALLYLLEDQPVEVSARGDCYLQNGVHDVVFCYLRFANGIAAHLHLSWLDPHKMRRLTVVGSERMAVVDDMEPERKLTIYEKAAQPRRTDAFGEYIQVRFGDIVCPSVPNDEPLRLECEHFASLIRSDAYLGANGHAAAAVVHVLEALQCSLDAGGMPVPVDGGLVVSPRRAAKLQALDGGGSAVV